jgi:hypothetical protein
MKARVVGTIEIIGLVLLVGALVQCARHLH